MTFFAVRKEEFELYKMLLFTVDGLQLHMSRVAENMPSSCASMTITNRAVQT